MSIDPRVALGSLTAALEEHLVAAASRRGDDDPSVEAAFFSVADAFETYANALYDAYGEDLPIDLLDSDDDDDEDDDDESDDEDDDTADSRDGNGADDGEEALAGRDF
ncbi:hypothetical protein RBS60_14295 [Sinomonas sp. ASV486]|uniref:Primosomal protein n=1 Tax=Sinomonas puerhi TaxID=3238584 RepID=A0AB39L7M2_9MICC|nr:hypothetical protein [Sinomonas sp. ASV486]MDQ4491368.1 hypothetical protein [Sinomonas sp. ASV486]